jgi:glycosyltransferase involved in cell wall biosynthesis
MFSGDSAAVPAEPGAVCLVTGDRLTFDAGPGGDTWDVAHLLAGKGWRVHVLYCGPERERPAGIANRPGEADIAFASVVEMDLPAEFRVRPLHESPHADRSECVRHCLERLHRRHGFSLVEFPCRGGLGFRSIQAKRAGLAFADIRFAVRLDRCSAWVREQDQVWAAGPEDLEVDFCERYAFEHADVRLGGSEELREFVGRLGWRRELVRELGELVSVHFSGRTHPWKNELTPISPIPDGSPLVTVSIAYHNLGRYLPETLASLAAQTYPNLEVLVIDDGSTDPHSVAVFEEMRARYPQFRFLTQPNDGIGATRNRGLREARGDFFIPVDADNVARPDLVERFVAGMRRDPDLAALTCYFLAFRDGGDLARGEYAYAYRPTGGPYVLASMRNVYGDANAIFRTASFRAVGGYETDRDTSNEDWEAFVKLAGAGYRLDVVPEHLFYYRHLDSGFSRVTNAYRNHRRVLRQFFRAERLPEAERVALWGALPGFGQAVERLSQRNQVLERRLGFWRRPLALLASLRG